MSPPKRLFEDCNKNNPTNKRNIWQTFISSAIEGRKQANQSDRRLVKVAPVWQNT